MLVVAPTGERCSGPTREPQPKETVLGAQDASESICSA